MRKLTALGNIPNTSLFWERYEWETGFAAGTRIANMTDYLLVVRDHRGRRKVVANLDMGQLVALRASIDALVAAEAEKRG